MGPTYLRVAAGACLVATGLFSGSGAIALAAPDSSGDNSNSHSQNASPKHPSARSDSDPSNANSGAAATGAAGRSTAKNRQPSPFSSPSSAASNNVGSTQGPAANEVASPPDAAAQAASSVPSALRGIGQFAPSAAVPSTVPILLPTQSSTALRTGVPIPAPLSLGSALAPLSTFVENFADALIGPQAAQPIMNVANQFLDSFSAANPAMAAVSHDSRNTPIPLLPVPPLQEIQTSTQLAPVLPGSLHDGSAVAPARLAAPAVVTPGVITPQLLSNRVNVSIPTPSTTAPATPDWFSGIASQIFHGVREALRDVSVTELALAALPGAVGLLFFIATGIGLGHRQAKFGFALASSGAVRFAVRGPLGVVRGGSSVAVHSRTKRAAAEVSPADAGAVERPRLRLVDRAA